MPEEGLPWYVYLLLGVAVGTILVWVAFKSHSSTPIASSSPPTALNEEVWEWIDYHGNKRRIVVHREAR